MKARLLLAVAVSLGLGACAGGLENPDLERGAVSGSVVQAAGGYVYVLGNPEVTAPIGTGGGYEIRGVPVGAQRLVLVAGYQGGGTSIVKAALAPVTVRGGMREQLAAQDAALMPAAGRVVAAVRPPAGASTQGATFTVAGTNQRDVAGSAGGQVLGDLPAGRWSVTAHLPGHVSPPPVVADVPEGGSAQVEFGLEVAIGDEAHRGCLSTGCENGLYCSAADGQCYGCLDAAQHCNPGDTCSPITHTCVEGTDHGGELCEAAESRTMCPGETWVQTQASPALGYCSRVCPGGTDAECPAGWACGAGVCAVAQSCSATRATFGSPCAKDDTCHPFLVGDVCVRGDEDHPGYCSAACTTSQSCRDAGLSDSWSCQPLPGAPAASQGYCQRAGN